MRSDDEEDESAPDGLAPPRSRSAEKRERVANETALADLVQRLRPLSARQLQTIGVPEPVRDALHDARQIKSRSALERHMRHLRVLLRDSEWQPLLRRIDLVRAGLPASPADEARPASAWANRLLIHGDPALHRFLEEFPAANRRRIREYVQNVRRSSDVTRAKARRVLENALHNIIRNDEAERARSA